MAGVRSGSEAVAEGAVSSLPAPVAKAVALSLAFSGRNAGSLTVPDGVRWDGCERVQNELRDAGSDAIVWVGCGAWVCPVCGPRKAKRYAEAIASTSPTTFGRLSLMPGSFEATRRQMYDLRKRLTTRYGSVEWAWVRHRNPKLTGYHVHFLGRMPWIPQRELQSMTGGRIPWIQAAKQELGSADYLMGIRERRGAAGYLLKRASRPEFWLDHLTLNGGRGVHWSREFFGGRSVEDVLREIRKANATGHWYRPGSPNPPDWRKGVLQVSEAPASFPRREEVTDYDNGKDSRQLRFLEG